ncbi:LPXTG cell wall anchor domain-containing protein [Asanoa sp. WMMD1127]|uniref:LPXTG cell wall anchor domain-containing protein n=1 Tax=Asanoa sp. WMMD1127 TaxID=3016107 RepID=UPI002415B08E|nr:LPXTG cell wall anchor domain-containing protein [Asanoa sp. WMMD1127]MDG4823537.1 LPXTG cell wall anchor domain-containing protein [Asanoa sp. WMMD1127]
MFHIPSALRRSLAVAGAAFVGLAATVALGSPASAHHPEVSGTATCVEGKWQVDWKVANSEQDLDGDLTGVRFSPDFQSDTVKVGAALPAFKGKDSVLRASQVLDAGVTSATLSVDAHWVRNGKDVNGTRSATVTVPERGCRTSKPSVTFTDDCAGQVTVVVSNGAEATKALRYTVWTEGGDEPVAKGTVEIGKSSEPIVVPPTSEEEPVKVIVKSGRTEIGAHEWTEPEGGCVPDIEIKPTCDELSITVTNPPNGLEFDLVFTPNTGEPQTMKVTKDSTNTVTFKAAEGLVVTPSVGEEDLEPIAWTKPDNCDEDTPTLPKTGVNAGALAGGAGGLLALGGAAFYLARRRKLRFTA